MQNQIVELMTQVDSHKRAMRILESDLPNRINEAVRAEKARSDKQLKELQGVVERVQQEFQREQVLRRTARQTNAEKLVDMERQVAEARKWVDGFGRTGNKRVRSDAQIGRAGKDG